jgi:hypothetical protein
MNKRLIVAYAAAATAVCTSIAMWAALPASGQVGGTGMAGMHMSATQHGGSTQMAGMTMPAPSERTTREIAAIRLATAKYATNLARAKADGYQIITKMMPDMGYHFLNPKISTFNIRKPPILVYEHTGTGWELGAVEWVFTSMPKNPPLPDATFGFFPAGCHYHDGTFIPDQNQATCPKKAPHSGASFFFWHPDLFTMHVWVWYPNPTGLYASTNPNVAPFNNG